jgi:hypothetical protein
MLPSQQQQSLWLHKLAVLLQVQKQQTSRYSTMMQ